MTCKRCGKRITEQTALLYRRRCVPCFRRLPVQWLKSFGSEGLLTLLILGIAPFAFIYYKLRGLWSSIAPVPFRRSHIIDLMTPLFGFKGANAYLEGLRYGFHNGNRTGDCCVISRPIERRSNHNFTSECRSAGRYDGAKLRRHPQKLQEILAHCTLRKSEIPELSDQFGKGGVMRQMLSKESTKAL